MDTSHCHLLCCFWMKHCKVLKLLQVLPGGSLCFQPGISSLWSSRSSFTSPHLLGWRIQSLFPLPCLALQPMWSCDELWSQCDHHIPGSLSLPNHLGAQHRHLCLAGSGNERSGTGRPACLWGIPSLAPPAVFVLFSLWKTNQTWAIRSLSHSLLRHMDLFSPCLSDAGLPFPSQRKPINSYLGTLVLHHLAQAALTLPLLRGWNCGARQEGSCPCLQGQLLRLHPPSWFCFFIHALSNALLR